jgi:DNA polymerase-4
VKLVAKLASELAKPDGLLSVPADRVREFLDPLPVGRIWGVGPVARGRLEALGIATIGDLAAAPEALLREALGSYGPEVARLARGEDDREVEPFREPKSYGEEYTFAEDVRDRARIERAIRAHAEAVARRLRHDALVARGVVLKLKLARPLGGGRYPLLTRSATLRRPSDDGATLAAAAIASLARVRERDAIRLVGVAAERLAPRGGEQLDLFGAGVDAARRERLNRALDLVRERFGAAALSRGIGTEERAGLSLARKRGET